MNEELKVICTLAKVAGDRLREYRIKQKLSQRAMARILGISQQNISAIECSVIGAREEDNDGVI